MSVALRNVGSVVLEVDSVNAVVEPNDVINVPGRIVTDPKEIGSALGLLDDQEANVADDVTHILEPSGQLRAWPTATWAVVTEPKSKEAPKVKES